jgi:hypothetical protein
MLSRSTITYFSLVLQFFLYLWQWKAMSSARAWRFYIVTGFCIFLRRRDPSGVLLAIVIDFILADLLVWPLLEKVAYRLAPRRFCRHLRVD